jgi:hypothetical protein
MPQPLKIIVGGYIVGYPLGGMTWHHLNYLLGLHALGHEVYFLEDSGAYSIPYNPRLNRCEIDPAYGLEYLQRTFAAYGLPLRYCYYSQFWDTHYGMSREQLHELLRSADLLLCVSGVTPLRPERPRPRRTAVIDTDPVFTQLRMTDSPEFRQYYESFDCVATFGTLIGAPGCPLPAHGFNWIPTVQPMALDHWPVVPATSRRFTTLGKWEHSNRDVEFQGRRYRSSKGPEWMKLIDLPRRVPWQMELAMQAMPPETAGQFREHGWALSDPEPASLTPQSFQQFIQNSAGEFTVAKEIYARLPSGWFSDRAAGYLASGRPVVTQSSGFEGWLPTGEGLFAYASVPEAEAALQAIAADYPRHAAAARHLAQEHFAARGVLKKLLQAVL